MDEGSQDKRIHGPGMYAIWNNGPAGSRRIRSRVFAVGLFRYIVCNLIISVVNNPVNKPRKNKTKIHVGSETIRWNEKERSMLMQRCYFYSKCVTCCLSFLGKDNKLLFQKMNYFFIIYGRIIIIKFFKTTITILYFTDERGR